MFKDLFPDLTPAGVEPGWQTVRIRHHGFDLEGEAHFSVDVKKEDIVTQTWVDALQAKMLEFLMKTDTLPSGITVSAWARPSFRASFGFGKKSKVNDKFCDRRTWRIEINRDRSLL